MDQEHISKFIKDIRTKNKLSQNEFAKKYGVTYQAVSKWENGKNMPDIQILNQICSDYNFSLENLLNGNNVKKEIKINKTNLTIIASLLIFLIIIISTLLIFLTDKDNNFEFKTLSSTSKYFSLTGSIAYNQDKTSLFISDVTYNGEDNIKYKSIKSKLYEIDGKTKTEIASHERTLLITLNEYLKNMTFNVDNHARVCEEYTKESLLLEISATSKEEKITKYEIPISISENCQK